MTKNNSKTKKKSIIDVYPTVYGLDVVVANRYTTTKQINKLYETVDHKDFDEDDGTCLAYTQCGYNKATNRPIILVKYCSDTIQKDRDKKLDLINTCAHEAVHVCMRIYSKIREDVYKDDDNELLAYLLGWVTENIYKTWTK